MIEGRREGGKTGGAKRRERGATEGERKGRRQRKGGSR